MVAGTAGIPIRQFLAVSASDPATAAGQPGFSRGFEATISRGLHGVSAGGRFLMEGAGWFAVLRYCNLQVLFVG